MSNRQHNWPARQRGMNKWGWLLFIGFAALAATTALRVGPHYVDFRIVQSVADRLPEKDVHTMSRAQITEHFSKQFRVENFRIKVKDMMKIERDREKTVLDINYEVREHLFYNIDVVLVFSDKRIYQ